MFSIIFYSTLLYSVYRNTEIMMGVTLKKNLGSPMPQQSADSYLQENGEQ